MLSSVNKHFFWPKLKADIVVFIAKCRECQLVKGEHQHPLGLLQPFPIPKWKWEVISMDFITILSKSKKQNDSIFVVIDKLSKASHFIPMKSTYKAVNIIDTFLKGYLDCTRYPVPSSWIKMLSLQETFEDIYSPNWRQIWTLALHITHTQRE